MTAIETTKLPDEAIAGPNGTPGTHRTDADGIDVAPADAPHPPEPPVTEAATLGVADQVLEIARTDPSRVALIHAHQRRWGRPRYERFTYGELSERAEALAAGLRAIGVEEGTRCSFMVPPCFDALVLGVALWRVGAVTVGIEPHSHGLRRVARCLQKVRPEVFFGSPEAHAARVAFGWGRSSIRTNVVVGKWAPPGMHTLRSLHATAPAEPQPPRVQPGDPAVVAFTTGSTGSPKPTVLRHRNIEAMIANVIEQWGFDDGSEVVDMPTFPMFWVIGLSVGGTVVIPPMDFALHGPGDADPARLLRTIEDCGVRSMFASPALLTNLAGHANERGITTPTLRRIVAGGAEVQGPLFAAVKRMLGPDGEIYSDYGATEALPVSEIAGATVVGETWPATEQGAGVCVGTPLPRVDVRIIAIDDGVVATWDDAVELPVGEIGEVVARSPHISEDYFDNPRATAENKIRDERGGVWHRLGDTGYLDGQGRLWVCGRRSHRVVTESSVTFPLCAEPVFNAHPAVARSALVGVHEGGRVVPTICVEPAAGNSTGSFSLRAELLVLAGRHRTTEAVERVEFVEQLPVDRRHNAKIDRPALAQRFSSPT